MKRLLLGMGLAFTLGFCGSAETVRVALDWTPNTNHTGLLVASAEGFYEEEGLELRLLEGGPTAPMQLVAAGRAEIGITSQEYVTMARAQGIPVLAVAALFPHNTSGFAAASDRGIQSPSDFVGKTYAGWGSAMEEEMVRTVMRLDGVDPGLVSFTNIGTLDFTTAIRLDVADFYWIFYGWQGVHAELLGIEFEYLSLRDLAPVLDYYTPVLVASESSLEENGKLIERFLRATALGYVKAASEPTASAEALLAYAPELDRDLVLASQEWLAEVSYASLGEWGWQEAGVWIDFSSWCLENGLIDSAIDPMAAFTNAFLPAKSVQEGVGG